MPLYMKTPPSPSHCLQQRAASRLRCQASHCVIFCAGYGSGAWSWEGVHTACPPAANHQAAAPKAYSCGYWDSPPLTAAPSSPLHPKRRPLPPRAAARRSCACSTIMPAAVTLQHLPWKDRKRGRRETVDESSRAAASKWCALMCHWGRGPARHWTPCPHSTVRAAASPTPRVWAAGRSPICRRATTREARNYFAGTTSSSA